MAGRPAPAIPAPPASSPGGLRRDLRAMGEVFALTGLPIPGIKAATPLRDSHPDAGLFGPGSTTWRLAREPSLAFIGGQRALLMQVANPLVGQAVLDHSDYAGDPYGRLLRTLVWLAKVTFGTRQEAEAATAGVAAVHRKVRGVLPAGRASAPYPSGTAYDARDPALALWILATLVQSAVVSYEAVVGRVADADRDAMVREWFLVAELFGIPGDLYWSDWACLERYVRDRIAEMGAMGPSARGAAGVVLSPPASALLRPVLAGTTFISIGLLPPDLRDAYGLRWTNAHQRAHQALCVSMRTSHHLFPRRLRVASFYDQAVARVAGA